METFKLLLRIKLATRHKLMANVERSYIFRLPGQLFLSYHTCRQLQRHKRRQAQTLNSFDSRKQTTIAKAYSQAFGLSDS